MTIRVAVFFPRGGVKRPLAVSLPESHFYQPYFSRLFRFFRLFGTKKPSRLFQPSLGLEGGGQRPLKDPWTSFSLKLAQKCLKLFLILLHLTLHGSIKSGGNILLFILKLMLKFLICFGKLLCIVQVAPLQTRFLEIHDPEHSIVQCR